MTFKERIKKGLAGEYKGLDNGFDRINRYLFGIQKSCYTLIGGLSGGGKSTCVDFFLLNAIKSAKTENIPLNIFYYSFEIDEFTKRANWLSNIIFDKYNVTISPEKIKGLGEFRLSQEELEIVNKELSELDNIFSNIHWIWETINPTGIYNEIWRFLEKRGHFIKENYITESGEEKQRIVKFIFNDCREQTIIVLDHICLCRRERKFNLKENIDKLSEYFVALRNIFGVTIFAIQQFNQQLNSVERQKFKGVDLSPSMNDFKDSTNPYQDCDVALGLLNAFKMDMETSLDYNIKKNGARYNLGERYRLLKIIKNRLSRDNIAVGLLFFPESGRFKELPKAKEITEEDIKYFNSLK